MGEKTSNSRVQTQSYAGMESNIDGQKVPSTINTYFYMCDLRLGGLLRRPDLEAGRFKDQIVPMQTAKKGHVTMGHHGPF